MARRHRRSFPPPARGYIEGRLVKALSDEQLLSEPGWSVRELDALDLIGKPIYYAHRKEMGQIGMIIDHWVDEEDWLVIGAKIFESSKFANDVYKSLVKGYLSALSIGFDQEDPKYGPVEYKNFLEASVTSNPRDPRALLHVARSHETRPPLPSSISMATPGAGAGAAGATAPPPPSGAGAGAAAPPLPPPGFDASGKKIATPPPNRPDPKQKQQPPPKKAKTDTSKKQTQPPPPQPKQADPVEAEDPIEDVDGGADSDAPEDFDLPDTEDVAKGAHSDGVLAFDKAKNSAAYYKRKAEELKARLRDAQPAAENWKKVEAERAEKYAADQKALREKIGLAQKAAGLESDAATTASFDELCSNAAHEGTAKVMAFFTDQLDTLAAERDELKKKVEQYEQTNVALASVSKSRAQQQTKQQQPPAQQQKTPAVATGPRTQVTRNFPWGGSGPTKTPLVRIEASKDKDVEMDDGDQQQQSSYSVSARFEMTEKGMSPSSIAHTERLAALRKSINSDSSRLNKLYSERDRRLSATAVPVKK